MNKVTGYSFKAIFSAFRATMVMVSLTAVYSSAATVYVSGDYNETTVGWGISAFNTIQAGINAVEADGTVNVAAGTYEEILDVNKAGVTVKAVGEAVVTFATVANDKSVITISADGATFDGFEVTTEAINKVVGIIVAAQNVTIKNTKIHDFVGALIRPDGAHNLLIEDCTLYNSSAFGIYPISKSDNVTIKGCYLAGSNGIRIYKNGTGWVIDGNYIAGRHNWDESVKFPFQTAQLGIAMETGSDHTAVNNVIVGVTQSGIKVEVDNCKVINNTIAFCYDWASTYSVPLILQPHVVGNAFAIRFKKVNNALVLNNNLAYNYRGIGVNSDSELPDAQSVIAFNNVFGGGYAGFEALGYVEGVDWENEAGKVPVDGFDWDPRLTAINSDWQTGRAGNISGDPKLVSLFPFNPRLRATSSCIDAGQNYGALTVDFDGNPRVIDGYRLGLGADTVDIGAFESPYIIPEIVYIDGEFEQGDSAGHIWGYNAFSDIQPGIDLVADGGIVSVAAGEYDGALSIDKALSILSESGAENTVIRNSSNAYAATVSILAGGVQIGAAERGFTILGFEGDAGETGQAAVQISEEANEGIRINYNRFNGSGMAISNLGSSELDGTKNWFGVEYGPTHSSNPEGSGAAVSDNVNFSPWYANSILTELRYLSEKNQETTTLGTPLAWFEQHGIVPPEEEEVNWDELDLEDSDGDGVPNWKEYLAGTDPNDAESQLKIVTIEWGTGNKPYIEWLGGTNGAAIPYDVEYSPTLNPANWQKVGQRERVHGTNDWLSASKFEETGGFFRIAVPLATAEQ